MQQDHQGEHPEIQPPSISSQLRRGAMFGGGTGFGIMITIGVIAVLLIPNKYGLDTSGAQKMLGIIGSSLLMAFYGAVIGAVIFGVRAMLRRR
jgi:hypothetical protein